MSALPKYVQHDRDRHGNPRWYYRRHGRRTRLDGRPGDDAFRRSYDIIDAAHGKPDVPLAHGGTQSFVYFIRYGNKRIKIGTCVNVRSRLQQLKTGVPGVAIVHYVTPGGRILETELHRMFTDDRISGEWFQFSAPIRDWIRADQEKRRRERGVNIAGTILSHHAPSVACPTKT